jgi:hypothetical protein
MLHHLANQTNTLGLKKGLFNQLAHLLRYCIAITINDTARHRRFMIACALCHIAQDFHLHLCLSKIFCKATLGHTHLNMLQLITNLLYTANRDLSGDASSEMQVPRLPVKIINPIFHIILNGLD